MRKQTTATMSKVATASVDDLYFTTATAELGARTPASAAVYKVDLPLLDLR